MLRELIISSSDQTITAETERALSLVNEAPLLIKKISESCCLNNGQSFDGLIEVIRFLDLSSISQNPLTPSIRVDNIWHEFILFTRLYENFCYEFYGRLIHHKPDDNSSANQQQFFNTLDFYKKKYGDPAPFYWDSNNILDLSGGCSSCENE